LRRCRAHDSEALEVVLVDFENLWDDHPKVRARQRQNNKSPRMLPKQRPNSAESASLSPNGAPPILRTEEMAPVGAVEHAIPRTSRDRQAVGRDSVLRFHHPHSGRDNRQFAGDSMYGFGREAKASPAVKLASGNSVGGGSNSLAPLLGHVACIASKERPSLKSAID
jgi:hypothetical protein